MKRSLCIALLAAFVAPASGQTPPPPVSSAYRTKAPPDEVLRRLQPLLPPDGKVSVTVIETATQGPQVQIRGESPAEVKRVTELIATLDQLALAKSQRTKVYEFKHARAESVANAVKRLLDIKHSDFVAITPDERTNRLLVVASEPQQEQAARLIEMLDVPAPKETDVSQVLMFSLKHASPDNLAPLLNVLLGNRAQFAADPQRRQIVIKAEPKLLEEAAQLLQRLDRPPATTQPADEAAPVQVRLVWLVTIDRLARTHEGQPFLENLQAPPQDLKEVITELETLGVRELRMVTQTIIPASDEDFSITAKGILDEIVQLTLRGRFRKATGNVPKLQVDLKTQEVPRPPAPPGGGVSGYGGTMLRDRVNLSTTLIAPVGHPIVLGVSAQADSQNVFVLQLLPMK